MSNETFDMNAKLFIGLALIGVGIWTNILIQGQYTYSHESCRICFNQTDRWDCECSQRNDYEPNPYSWLSVIPLSSGLVFVMWGYSEVKNKDGETVKE